MTEQESSLARTVDEQLSNILSAWAIAELGMSMKAQRDWDALICRATSKEPGTVHFPRFTPLSPRTGGQ